MATAAVDGEETPSRWMELGKEALRKDDYPAAIGYFTKATRAPDLQVHQEALELLGLARERNGQMARAKSIYEEYLRLYPKGEDATRVRQRLAGLTTASLRPPGAKLKAPGDAESPGQWEYYGAISQYFRRDAGISDEEGEIIQHQSLNSFLDFTGKYRGSRYDFRFQFNGRYFEDFQNEDRSGPRISYGYVDGADRELGISGRLGRQTRSSGGVLGRFDGGALSYRISPHWQINVVGGQPVQPYLYRAGPTSDKSFYGFSLDFGPFFDHWAGNVFFIDQTADGLSDRRAIGGEMRYLHPKFPTFALLDYDVMFSELNTAHLVSNWNFDDGATGATAYVALDYRKTPLLTTSNAIMGTGFDSVGDLRNSLTRSEIHKLARAQTATSKSVTVGGSVPISDKYQLNGDVTWANLSGAGADLLSFWGKECFPAGIGPSTNTANGLCPPFMVGRYPGTGDEWSYGMQLVAHNLPMEGATTVFGLRYADRRDVDIASLQLDTTYPIADKWRIEPRFRFDHYSGAADGDTVTVRPALRLGYRPLKPLSLELESGFEWSSQPLFPGDVDDSKGYYFVLGYRLDF
ncbi:MAG TPA: tetratricopeptide repeat protein [Methylococcaceae bacterium]|nr:tetratricopeptide repeat protein [Methylococcaceae bacterium]